MKVEEVYNMKPLAENYPIGKLHKQRLRKEKVNIIDRILNTCEYQLYDNYFNYEGKQLLQKVIFYLEDVWNRTVQQKGVLPTLLNSASIEVGNSFANIYYNEGSRTGFVVVLTLNGKQWHSQSYRDYITIIGEHGVPNTEVFYYFKDGIVDPIRPNERNQQNKLGRFSSVNYENSVLLSIVSTLISLLNLQVHSNKVSQQNEKQYCHKHILRKKQELQNLKNKPLNSYLFTKNEKNQINDTLLIEEKVEVEEEEVDGLFVVKEENINSFLYIKELGESIEDLNKHKSFTTFISYIDDIFSHIEEDNHLILKMTPLFKNYLPNLQQAFKTLKELTYKGDTQLYSELLKKTVSTLDHLNHWMQESMNDIYKDKKENAESSLDKILSDFTPKKLNVSNMKE